MGKTLRAIGAGVGAGLTQLAGSMQQNLDNERADKRLEKEDAFKDRQLKVQEDNLAMAREQADRAKRDDRTKMLHSKMVAELAGKDDPREVLRIISGNNNGNLDPTNFTFNDPARSEKDNLNPDGTPAYAVMDISYNKTDPETGEILRDPVTGGPEQRRVDDKRVSRKVFKTRAEFEEFKYSRINPEKWLADSYADWTSDKKYKQAADLAEFNRKQAALDDQAKLQTESGKAGLAKTKSETAENIANAEKLRADAGTAKQLGAASTQPTDSVMDLDGKIIKLTTAESNSMNKTADKLVEVFPGISPEDAWRVDKGLSNTTYRTFVDKSAAIVAEDPKKRNEAIKAIAKRFRVKNDVAAGLLDQGLKYVDEPEKVPWWKSIFSGDGGNSSSDDSSYSTMN